MRKLISSRNSHPVRVFLLVAIGFVFSVDSSWGSGFSIGELGARAAGMGTAFTSIADDGSALFYNPAGIAFQRHTGLQMDTLLVKGKFHFFPSAPPPGTVVPQEGFNGAVSPKVILVSNLYFTREFSPKWTFGFGAFTPFGLSDNFTSFKDSDPQNTKYPGRFAGSRGRLESIWFQPTAAYRLSPNSSVAIGVALVFTHLMIEQSFLNPRDDAIAFGRETAEQIFPGVDKEQAARSIARLLPEGRSRIAGTSKSPGFNIGYLYKHPGWKTNFGLMFRSAVTNHLKGRASFAFTKDYPLEKFVGADLLLKAFPNQDITGSFTTPATYAVGISTSARWNSTIAFDFRIQDYRRFRSVPLNFSKTQALDKDVRTPAEKRLVFDFRNSYYYAFGFEKPLGRNTVIRTGYLFDRTSVVDKSVGPLFPDSNRHSFTVGASRRVGNKEFMFFYDATKFVHRTTNVAANVNQFTNGEYRNFAHLLGVGLRFVIGGPANLP